MQSNLLAPPDPDRLLAIRSTHRPRIPLLYGSVRERSFSRFLTMEAPRLLEAFGARKPGFSIQASLPLPDDAPADHPKVQELRELSGVVRRAGLGQSPERHGAMRGHYGKAQIDWIPLAIGAVRPTQGKTLAVMQVSGGSQSFNAINQLRVLGLLDANANDPQPVIRRKGI